MKYIITVLFACLCLATQAQKTKTNCTITIRTTDAAEGKLYFRNLTQPQIDTIYFKNNQYTHSTTLEEITPFVMLDENNKHQLFFVEPGKTIEVTMMRNPMMITQVSGTQANNVFVELSQLQDPLQSKAQELQTMYYKPNMNQDSIANEITSINAQLKANFFSHIKKYSTSPVMSYIVFSAVANDRNVTFHHADSIASFLEGKAKTGFYGKELEKLLSKLKSVEVGFMAPNFQLPDSSGKKMYSLSDFKGRYVLVDFWASWCGPCKTEIPFLKQAYEKFHSKGFEIVSVSLDSKRDGWISALNQFQMPWVHVSDVKGFNSIVNDLYYVPAIPKTLLLDKTGKIIATDLRGNSLEQKLAELLGK